MHKKQTVVLQTKECYDVTIEDQTGF